MGIPGDDITGLGPEPGPEPAKGWGLCRGRGDFGRKAAGTGRGVVLLISSFANRTCNGGGNKELKKKTELGSGSTGRKKRRDCEGVR